MAKKEDIYKLGWDEYVKEELDVLLGKVQSYVKENNVKIDAVVPLLRGGNIPGTYLAYKLQILRIAPVQYKYFFKDEVANLVRIQKVNKDLFKKDSKITFLLVEGNHCYGTSAYYAAKDLKEHFPNCKIIYAASNLDPNYKDVVNKYAEVTLYGALNNACEELSEEECAKMGIEYKKIPVFPWEDIDEEWVTFGEFNQFPFKDVKEAEAGSKLCEEISLSEFTDNAKEGK